MGSACVEKPHNGDANRVKGVLGPKGKNGRLQHAAFFILLLISLPKDEEYD